MANVVSLKLLETVFNSPNAYGLTQGSPAHENGLRFVAEVLRWNQDPDIHVGLIGGLLPETYKGNLLPEVPGMMQDGVHKGFHYPQDRAGDDEGKQSEVILALLEDHGAEFFNSPQNDPHIRVAGKRGGKVVHRLRSSFTNEFLRRLYFDKTKKPPSAMAVKEALAQLEANARYNAPVEEVYLRIAKYGCSVFVDLGDESNRAIEVTSEGWEIVDEVPVNFVRPNGAVKSLPLPEDGFEPEELRQLLGMSMQNFLQMIAFCISVFNPNGPYFVLQIHGEQGSGKSFVSKFVKDLTDPNIADKLRLPRTEQDMVLHAQGQWVLNYDNTSYVSNDLSDLLCTIATGGAFATRRLYSDDELFIAKYKRPAMMNGITGFALRQDLSERSIFLNLPAVPEGKRKTERELYTNLAKLMPKCLGYILDCVSCAIANLDEVEPPRSIRMADAAHWLAAAEPATGFPEGAILDALEGVQREILAQTAIDDALTVALMTFLLKQEQKKFEGRFGPLHEELMAASSRNGRGLPASPSALSSKIKRMQPGLRQIGLNVEEGMRNSGGQTVILSLNSDGIAFAQEIATKEEGDGSF